MPKPSILIFIEHYIPGYKFGGPIRSVANLVTLLKPHYAIYLVTRDRDQGDKQAYEGIVVNRWIYENDHHIIYLSPSHHNIGTVNRLIRERTYDFLYTNSLFSHFTRMLLLLSAFSRRRLTIAPRGELHDGAVRLKAYKKRPYISLVRLLADNLIIWHATDQQEVEAIQRTFDRPRVACVPIRFAPDMPGRFSKRSHWIKEKGRLRLLSVARIAKNKGLKFLLECLPAVSSGQLILDIYGPIVDIHYWEECQELITKMPPTHRVTYQGELNHANVGQTMQQYDFLAMPTHGENFGHVIFEALSSGLPVLISDQTPWKQLAATAAGWDLPLQHARWTETLEICLNMDNVVYSPLIHGTERTAQAYIDEEPFEESYLNLFSR